MEHNRGIQRHLVYSSLFLGVLIAFMNFEVAGWCVGIGPDRCDGAGNEDWDLPYACDLNVSYAEQFLITDARDDYPYYTTVDSYDIHTLDVFYPRSCLRTRDCTVFINIHGGAWKDYYKTMIDGPESIGAQNAPWYMAGKKGWIVVVPDYRLCNSRVYTAASCPNYPPEEASQCQEPKQAAVYPDNVDDINLIVDWVHKNGHLYGARSDGSTQYATDIWLMGHSAGGHLVMDWATNPRYQEERHKVKGVIGLSGAYDIENLAPVLSIAVNDTFQAHGGMTALQWQRSASPVVNLEKNPAYPYPHLMILDCGENDFANLGDPVRIASHIYPDNAQELADLFRKYGYRVSEDIAEHEADLWHIKLDPSDYDHIDEYAAIAYTGDDTDQDYFERLYLPWVPMNERDCSDDQDTLGPNNGDTGDGCRQFAKPPGGSWKQPADLMVEWIESFRERPSILMIITPVLSALVQKDSK